MNVLLWSKRLLTDIRFIYASIGIVASIIAHELFHVVIHAGHITKIELFADIHTIVAITSTVSAGYDFVAEEFIAYGISAIILFITCIDVMAIHDSRSERSVKKTLFPKLDIDDATIHDLALKAKIL